MTPAAPLIHPTKLHNSASAQLSQEITAVTLILRKAAGMDAAAPSDRSTVLGELAATLVMLRDLPYLDVLTAARLDRAAMVERMKLAKSQGGANYPGLDLGMPAQEWSQRINELRESLMLLSLNLGEHGSVMRPLGQRSAVDLAENAFATALTPGFVPTSTDQLSESHLDAMEILSM